MSRLSFRQGHLFDFLFSERVCMYLCVCLCVFVFVCMCTYVCVCCVGCCGVCFCLSHLNGFVQRILEFAIVGGASNSLYLCRQEPRLLIWEVRCVVHLRFQERTNLVKAAICRIRLTLECASLRSAQVRSTYQMNSFVRKLGSA